MVWKRGKSNRVSTGINKELASHLFIAADRRHKPSASETKDFTKQRKATARKSAHF